MLSQIWSTYLTFLHLSILFDLAKYDTQLFIFIMFNELIKKFLQELAFEHGVESEFLLASSVIGYALVWPIVSSDFVAEVTPLNFGFGELLIFCILNSFKMGEDAFM